MVSRSLFACTVFGYSTALLHMLPSTANAQYYQYPPPEQHHSFPSSPRMPAATLRQPQTQEHTNQDDTTSFSPPLPTPPPALSFAPLYSDTQPSHALTGNVFAPVLLQEASSTLPKEEMPLAAEITSLPKPETVSTQTGHLPSGNIAKTQNDITAKPQIAQSNSPPPSSPTTLPPPPPLPMVVKDSTGLADEDLIQLIPEAEAIFGAQAPSVEKEINNTAESASPPATTLHPATSGADIRTFNTVETLTHSTSTHPRPENPTPIKTTKALPINQPQKDLSPLAESTGIGKTNEPDKTSQASENSATYTSSTDSAPIQNTSENTLSEETLRILSMLPSNINQRDSIIRKNVSIARENPNAGLSNAADEEVIKHEDAGLSIAIKRRHYDAAYDLQRAYDTLLNGNTGEAITIYHTILTNAPRNEDALFGLAATYQRIGNVSDARHYYEKLFAVSPKHREGISNFLALVADESPQEALPYLEELEQRNPDFSAVPAQIALILQRIGDIEGAKEAMLRAISQSPESLIYRYNMAIILDTAGNKEDATYLYRQLIDAAQKGLAVPADINDIQKRLTFISSNG